MGSHPAKTASVRAVRARSGASRVGASGDAASKKVLPVDSNDRMATCAYGAGDGTWSTPAARNTPGENAGFRIVVKRLAQPGLRRHAFAFQGLDRTAAHSQPFAFGIDRPSPTLAISGLP